MAGIQGESGCLPRELPLLQRPMAFAMGRTCLTWLT